MASYHRVHEDKIRLKTLAERRTTLQNQMDEVPADLPRHCENTWRTTWAALHLVQTIALPAITLLLGRWRAKCCAHCPAGLKVQQRSVPGD